MYSNTALRFILPLIVLIILTLCLPVPALAQFGFGFGGWYGGGGSGSGSWFGFSLWPNRNHYVAPTPQMNSSKIDSRKNTNGYLQGQVSVQSVCPAVDQPDMACPLAPDALENVTISAQPEGINQWLVSHPNAQGYYNLSLPPGRYQVTITHPALHSANPAPRNITIQAGQTLRQDFQITVPVQ